MELHKLGNLFLLSSKNYLRGPFKIFIYSPHHIYRIDVISSVFMMGRKRKTESENKFHLAFRFLGCDICG